MRIEFKYPEQEGPTDLRLARYSGPELAQLDEAGRRLYYRACDLTARFWLNEQALPEFDARNFEGSAMLIHAERYLTDRLAYELGPWPKGKIKIEPDDAYALPPRRNSINLVIS